MKCLEHFSFLCVLTVDEFMMDFHNTLNSTIFDEEEVIEYLCKLVEDHYIQLVEALEDCKECCDECEDYKDLYWYIVDTLDKMYTVVREYKDKDKEKLYKKLVKLYGTYCRGVYQFEKQVMPIEDIIEIHEEKNMLIKC